MPAMSHQSGLVSHTIYVGKHRTCIRLDHVSWTAVQEVVMREGITPSQLYARIAIRKPPDLSFTVAVRQYLMQYFRAAATEDGHVEAGHGSIILRMRSGVARAA
jgi:predicted DNA-binding ribbon-helix-helix protein